MSRKKKEVRDYAMETVEGNAEAVQGGPGEDLLLTESSPAERLNEVNRRMRYAVYRAALGYSMRRAAERAGYTEYQIEKTHWLYRLDATIRQSGILADVEIPMRDLFASQAPGALASIVDLMQNSKNDRVKLDAATRILAMAGYATSTTRVEAVDIAERELNKLSLKDQQKFREHGEIPENAQALKRLPEGGPPATMEEVLKEAQENGGRLMA